MNDFAVWLVKASRFSFGVLVLFASASTFVTYGGADRLREALDASIEATALVEEMGEWRKRREKWASLVWLDSNRNVLKAERVPLSSDDKLISQSGKTYVRIRYFPNDLRRKPMIMNDPVAAMQWKETEFWLSSGLLLFSVLGFGTFYSIARGFRL